jgi:phage N-6-adenine-methyltransferase
MNKTTALFSSKTPEWETPQFLFDGLDAEFGFELDVCATADKAKCKMFFTPEDDGLKQDWGTRVCWMNPPYGRTIGQWLQKAYESSKRGATVICLLPARTDTDWWHRYAQRGEVRFLRGRLKFGNAVNSAPFPSAVVIFKPWCIK